MSYKDISPKRIRCKELQLSVRISLRDVCFRIDKKKGDGRRAIYAVSVNALKTGTLFSISLSLEHRIDLVRKIMEDITMPLAADGTRSVYDELCTQIEDIMRSLLLGDSESLDDLRQYSCNGMLFY